MVRNFPSLTPRSPALTRPPPYFPHPAALQGKIGKGTPSMGRRHTKAHTECRRCGRITFHMQTQECGSCGYPSSKMRSCEWRGVAGPAFFCRVPCPGLECKTAAPALE